MMRRRLLATIAVVVVAAGAATRLHAAPDLSAMERAVAADPENLRTAADYRQAAIAAGAFDRSISFFERLAKRKAAGPNAYLSYALALVDKVPVAGEFRRLFLGRDAMTALTKSIEIKPSVLAYYIRGLINIYYNNAIFHRVPRGIADFEAALKLVSADTPTLLGWRVYMSMGDAYWRLEDHAKAREVWKNGLSKYPGTEALGHRIDDSESSVEKIVHDAVDPDLRVDTTLHGVVP